MDEKMRLKLEADCNSLNGIAGVLRGRYGLNGSADVLLSIQSHIERVLEDAEK